MILRAMAIGFLLWLGATLALRFAGAGVFTHDSLQVWYITVAPAMIAVTWALLKLLRVSRGDEAEAAIGFAAPGMLLDVYAVSEFQSLFPDLDPLLAQEFGALLLLGYGAMLVTGVLMTRISPRDERVVQVRDPEQA